MTIRVVGSSSDWQYTRSSEAAVVKAMGPTVEFKKVRRLECDSCQPGRYWRLK